MTDSRGTSGAGNVAAALAVTAVLAFVLLLGGAAHATGAVWNITRIGAPSSADGVRIAVVDSGVDASHPAFGGRVVQQVDYVQDGASFDGHGTHVAGTAAGGSIDCGSGPAAIGVAPTAAILDYRVLDSSGSGTVTDVARAIRQAADDHAAVINLSLGSDVTVVTGNGQTLRSAIDYAWGKGSIPVLAAGNTGLVGDLLGSGYDSDLPALVVTATTRTDAKASYATPVGSAQWGIAAPGGDGSGRSSDDVLSAWPDHQCALLAGTSMAAPHVSGALAVLRARGLSPRQAVDRLLETADDLGSPRTFGAGLVDLARATAGLGSSAAPPPPGPPPTTTTVAPDHPGPTAPTTQTETPNAAAPSSSTVPSTTAPPAAGPDRPPAAGDGGAERAAGRGRVTDVDAGSSVGAPLALGAGVVCAVAWAATGRAVLLRRRRS